MGPSDGDWPEAGVPTPPRLSPFAAAPQPLPARTTEAVSPRARKRRSLTFAPLGVVLTASLVSGAVGGVVGYSAAESAQTPPQTTATEVRFSEASNQATTDERTAVAGSSISEVAELVRPSVVHVIVESGDELGTGGSGSGFFISKDGLLITNNHVAAAAGPDGKISVQSFSGEVFPAEVVGKSPEYDLAVLRVTGIEATPVVLGNSKRIRVGETAIAVGSPLGLQGTVTSGIISALDRAVIAGTSGEASYLSAIQTDAAINPGNSGGPLVNMKGEVIGVNTAIATLSNAAQSGSIGLGFAVPVDIVKRVSKEIVETGVANTPIAGVEVDLEFGGVGARMKTVSQDGPAYEGGLRPGDVVTAVGNMAVSDASTFIVAIRSLIPGEVVLLTAQRNGRTLEIPVRLGILSP